MHFYELHLETWIGRALRWLGLTFWLSCSVLAILLGNRELFASAGALGICFLLAYIYFERRAVRLGQENATQLFIQPTVDKLKEVNYDQLTDAEKLQYNEALSDVGSVEHKYASDINRVEFIEFAVAIFMTLQWSFGGFANDMLIVF